MRYVIRDRAANTAVHTFYLVLIFFLLTAMKAPVQGAVLVDHKEYSVTHFFEFTPAQSVVPTVNVKHFQHAWVRDPALRYQVNPAGQPVGFHNDGLDFQAATGNVVNVPRGGGVPLSVNQGSVPIGSSGINFPPGSIYSVFVPSPTNDAYAGSRFGLDNFSAGTPLRGEMQSEGYITAKRDTVTGLPNPSEAYAFSSSTLEVAGGKELRSGQILWAPQIITPAVAGGLPAGVWQNWRYGRDPINFSILDTVTGDLLEETLLDITFDIRGDGSFDWESLSGLFQMDVEEGYFSIDISSPYTTQQGTVQLAIQGGVVTTSVDTGMFDGLFPAVGSSGNFNILLPYFTLDYDFGNFNGHDLDIVAKFSGSGAALAGVPEPGTILVVSSGMLGMMLRRRRVKKLAVSQS
jgi:hypothetical protein